APALNTFHIVPNPLILSGPKMNGPDTLITYDVNPTDDVSFEIYTILGQLVISKTPSGVGPGSIVWDGKNDKGKIVSSGIYLIFMRVNGKIVGSALKFGVLR